MPSNKKPRKKYQPKPVSIGYDTRVIEGMKQTWQRIEFGAYISLQNGSAKADDIFCLRDMYNVCLVDLVIRKDIEEDMAKDAWELIHSAGNATKDIYYRGCKEDHFVAKGDELKLIMEATRVCGEYVQESLNTCPGTFMQEWATAKALTISERPIANKEISTALIKRTFYSMTPEKFKAMTR